MKMICEVEGCGVELSEGTGSKGGPMICPNCRSPSYYWKNKPLAAMKARRANLTLYGNRLEFYDKRVAMIVNDATKAVASTRRQANTAKSASSHHMRH
jgi:hypothetical protein